MTKKNHQGRRGLAFLAVVLGPLFAPIAQAQNITLGSNGTIPAFPKSSKYDARLTVEDIAGNVVFQTDKIASTAQKAIELAPRLALIHDAKTGERDQITALITGEDKNVLLIEKCGLPFQSQAGTTIKCGEGQLGKTGVWTQEYANKAPIVLSPKNHS